MFHNGNKSIIEDDDILALRGMQKVEADGEQWIVLTVVLSPNKQYGDDEAPRALFLSDGVQQRMLEIVPPPEAAVSAQESLAPVAEEEAPAEAAVEAPVEAPEDHADIPLDAPVEEAPAEAPVEDAPVEAPLEEAPAEAPVEAPVDEPVA